MNQEEQKEVKELLWKVYSETHDPRNESKSAFAFGSLESVNPFSEQTPATTWKPDHMDPPSKVGRCYSCHSCDCVRTRFNSQLSAADIDYVVQERAAKRRKKDDEREAAEIERAKALLKKHNITTV